VPSPISRNRQPGTRARGRRHGHRIVPPPSSACSSPVRPPASVTAPLSTLLGGGPSPARPRSRAQRNTRTGTTGSVMTSNVTQGLELGLPQSLPSIEGDHHNSLIGGRCLRFPPRPLRHHEGVSGVHRARDLRWRGERRGGDLPPIHSRASPCMRQSSVLTDWHGGGFVGIHGTDAPQLIPGRVSHGCIRLRNRDI
jgi:hypothetical protein